MNERIQQFERLWAARPQLPRLMFDLPVLVRQTNEHHRLPPDRLDAYWKADSREKAALLATLSPIDSLFRDPKSFE